MISPPQLSVVICTRNRLQSLKRCLKELGSVVTDRQWEIVIVDNASSDGTSEYLKTLCNSVSNGLRLVTTFEAKPGLAAARNKGWRTAAACIISFTDDDCYVAPDYVDAVLGSFENHPDIGFLGGRILLYDDSDYKITVLESQDELYFRPRVFVPAGAVQGANMAFTKATLERIGGFDERLGAGTPFPCEDIDAVAAALWAGIPGIYSPRPLVYHHHGRQTEGEVRKLRRSYDDGRGAYYAKYILKKPSRWEYSRAWIYSARGEFIGTIRRGGLPKMRQSLREFASGLRYVISDLLPGARRSTSIQEISGGHAAGIKQA